MTVLGCIADDFTGATDLAGLLARGGVAVSLRIGLPAAPPAEGAAIEVIALKIRTAPVADAVAEALAALDWLRAAGARRFFWKYCSTFDSTPQGNIGPVAEALMGAIGARQVIYCPAFPENGRTVYMGNLFVGRQPLAESPMKDHPLTPMRDSDLTRLLRPQVRGSIGLIDHLTVAQGAGAVRAAVDAMADTAHIVCDAISDADLQALAEGTRHLPLISGGSALAQPLPAQIAGAAAAPKRWQAVPGGTVVLSGSCSAMTRAQVAHYIAAGAPALRLEPMALASGGPQAALDWLAAQDFSRAPLLYATAGPDEVRAAQAALGTGRACAIVEDALAAAATLARDRGARRFVVAGGETSGAVTRALGVERLDIGPEIAPGVPWTRATSAGQPVALALKSGNFGAEDFFTRAQEMLDER